MARPLTYSTRIRVNITAEHERAIEREAALTGTSPSAVVRSALAAYFDQPKRRRRARAS